MKKTIIICLSLITAFTAISQSSTNKLGITFGGGSQKYRGDLGSGFTIKNTVWRGGVVLNTSYYVNKSFDAGIYGSIGDFGYCQPHDMVNKVVPEEDRCDGCVDRLGLGNLSSRMYVAGVSARYKFNNGYILAENAKIQPYVTVGVSVNKLTDRMKMNCVEAGNYMATQVGIGAKVYVSERVNIGYTMTVGAFASDKLDFLDRGTTDMYLQNNVYVGIDLF